MSAAIRLLDDADGLIEHLGACGRHPDVWAAAGLLVEAYAAADMGALRRRLDEFESVVRCVVVG